MRAWGTFAPRATLVGAGLLAAAAAAPASAAISPTRDAPTVIRLAVDPAKFASGTKSMPSFFTGDGSVISLPPTGNPVGTGDAASALVPFPLDDTGFIVMSTGDATQAGAPDRAGTFPDSDDGGPALAERGLPGVASSARDVTVLAIPVVSPSRTQTSCVSFDLRFLSEEYPSRLTSAFNDAFIAEIDATTWTATGSTISAPDNFAALPNGQPLTIKATGFAAMSPAEAAGTPYGAATALLHAHVTVSPGAAHTLYLSLFDHGDSAVDSAVFIDDLTLSTPAGSDCAAGLHPIGPAVAITGPAVAATVDTATPTLSGTATGPGAVTVRIYEGQVAAGIPVQTLTATRLGDTWSVPTLALTPGQYTAQATQAGAGADGVSAPVTFTVPGAPAAPAPPSLQAPGDRDNDGIPDDQDTSDGSLPPIPGKTFDARVISGEVFVKYPPGTGPRAAAAPTGFVPLKGAQNVPIGAQLDTSNGRVAVTSAADTSGSRAQTSDFYDGVFQVKQSVPRKKPKKAKALITDLVLKGEAPRSQCGPLKGARSAGADKKKGPKAVLGQLWGNGKGSFRTSGKYSSATVRGTLWLVQDRCEGTLTKVARGTVRVQDFQRNRTVTVKAGHSYLARAARAASKRSGKK